MELNTLLVTQSPPPVHQTALSHENDFAKLCLLLKPNCLLLRRGSGGRKEVREEGKKRKRSQGAWEKHLKEKRRKNLFLLLGTSPYKYFFPFLVSSVIFSSIIVSFPPNTLPTSERVQFPQVLCESMLVFTLLFPSRTTTILYTNKRTNFLWKHRNLAAIFFFQILLYEVRKYVSIR